jgi:predicted transcriptional regulator of viral defense system
MPKTKYKEFVEKLREASVFSFNFVENKLGKNYSKVFIHNLKKKGEIIQLIKGWYTFKKSPYLVTVPLQKAYIGLGTAAFIHGAWNQIPAITVLSPNAFSKAKSGEREIGGQKVIIKKISEKMYFGYALKNLDGEWIRVSDPEKTLIDIVYYHYPFADEIMGNLIDVADKKKLSKYLKIMEKKKARGYKKIRTVLS